MANKKGPNIPPAYKKAFFDRIRGARVEVKYLYPRIIDFESAMGLPIDHWKQYEGRTVLPPHMVEQFCRLTGKSAWWLFTGHHKALEPTAPEAPPEAKKTTKKKAAR